MTSMALLIALALPTWLAFLIVAVVNIGAGGALTAAFAAKARAEPVGMPRTAEEIRRDKEWLASMGNGGSAPSPRTSEPLAAGRASDESVVALEADRTPPGEARPAGKAGATPDLGPRTEQPKRGQPVAGGTSTPNGQPMIAEHPDTTH
jgi:Putative Actinobacterial Holin-X, holin superfamily III